MRKALSKYAVLATFCLCFFAPQHGIYAASPLPWELRDHYSFKSDRATFNFEVATGAWAVTGKGLDTLIDSGPPEIVLEDNTVIKVSDLRFEGDGRKKETTPFGKATLFDSRFRSRDGFLLTVTLFSFEDRPFVMVRYGVVNTGPRPLRIKSLRATLSPHETVSPQRSAVAFDQRWGFADVTQTGENSFACFPVNDGSLTIGVGVARQGVAASSVLLAPANAKLPGRIESRFDPPLALETGASAESDAIWIAFTASSPADVLWIHSWVQGAAFHSARGRTQPSAWLTVRRGDALETLFGALDRWGAVALTHAVLPATWQGVGGSLEGSIPLYSKDLRRATLSTEAKSFVPVITIDPTSRQARNYGIAGRTRARTSGAVVAAASASD